MGEVQEKRILSIQSHVVHGYVGNKCAVFPLQVLGFDVDFINSVQLSNHTGYGQFRGQILADTDLYELWKGLGENGLRRYTHIITGYIGSESFLRQVADLVKNLKKENPEAIYLCDPVLGDNNEFYVPRELIPIYQEEILPLADITTPNTFELELLSGHKVRNEEDALAAMRNIHERGVKSVVLSSLDEESSNLSTFVSKKDGENFSAWKINSPRISGQFTGTGDLFAALFLGWFSRLDGDVPEALRTTLATMEDVLKRTKNESRGIGTAPPELRLIQSIDSIRDPPQRRPLIALIPKETT